MEHFAGIGVSLEQSSVRMVMALARSARGGGGERHRAFRVPHEYRHYGGDHIIFIGHVERYAYTHKPTLLFCRGKYMRGEPLIPTLSRAPVRSTTLPITASARAD
jgi:hypothetical protein